MTRLILSLLFLTVVFSCSTRKSSVNQARQDFLNNEIYGAECGMYPQPPALREEIEVLISQNDTVGIDKWLDSDVVAKKVYAVEALVRLSNSTPLHLSQHQMTTIDLIKSDTNYVTTCNGCVIRSMKIKEALQSFKLK